MLGAAIFDMDGLLIDSEPLWTRAEIQVFATVGIELTDQTCAQTVGLGLAEVVEFRFHESPWSNKSKEQVANEIHAGVEALIRAEGRAMPGALEAIDFVRGRGVKVGLATSSDRALIAAFTDRLGLEDAFDHLQSADELPRGKPHPRVYLEAAAALSVSPERCVAFEDSIPGLIAAKAAKMRAVAVPERRLASDPRYALADLILEDLTLLDTPAWDRLNTPPQRA